MKTLQKVYPYNDTLVRLQISGNTLREVLQYGVSAYPTLSSWPQVQNIRYSFFHTPNMQSPTGYATNIVNANLFNGTAMYNVGGEEANVVLVTNSYIASANSGFDMLKGAKVISKSSATINAIVAMYIAEQGAVGAPIDGRIVDCTGRNGDPFCVAASPTPPTANTPPSKPASSALI